MPSYSRFWVRRLRRLDPKRSGKRNNKGTAKFGDPFVLPTESTKVDFMTLVARLVG